jgi:hypothetical protein
MSWSRLVGSGLSGRSRGAVAITGFQPAFSAKQRNRVNRDIFVVVRVQGPIEDKAVVVRALTDYTITGLVYYGVTAGLFVLRSPTPKPRHLCRTQR